MYKTMENKILVFFSGATRPFFYNDTPQYRLYDQLFTGYNTKLRPRYNATEPVEVGIEYELNTVAGLVRLRVHLLF